MRQTLSLSFPSDRFQPLHHHRSEGLVFHCGHMLARHFQSIVRQFRMYVGSL